MSPAAVPPPPAGPSGPSGPPLPRIPRWADGEGLPLALVVELLRARGIHLTRERGQHFLVEPTIHSFLLRAAELEPGEVVLEVGPGIGTLTGYLLSAGARVLAVELDRGLHEFCAERFAGAEGLALLHADILAGKHALNPEAERELSRLMAAMHRQEFKLVANLPYSIATSLLVTLAAGRLPWERLVVTVQREVALRLASAPGTGQYGPATVLLGSVAEVEVLRILPPAVFWPAPQVESAIIAVRPRAGPEVRAALNRAAFAGFVGELFTQRRKTLATTLKHMGGSRPAWRRAVEPVLAEAGIAAEARAETLSPEQFEMLFRQMTRRMAESGAA